MSSLRLLADYDRVLLLNELDRMKQRGYSFQGETEDKRLGVDSWVRGVKVVEEKQRPKKKGKTK